MTCRGEVADKETSTISEMNKWFTGYFLMSLAHLIKFVSTDLLRTYYSNRLRAVEKNLFRNHDNNYCVLVSALSVGLHHCMSGLAASTSPSLSFLPKQTRGLWSKLGETLANKP